MYHHQTNLLVFVALNQMSSLKALDERIAIYNNETPLNILLVKWSQLKLNLEIAVVKSNVLNFGVLPICLGLLVSCNRWWWVFSHKLFTRQASLLANDTISNIIRVTKLFASHLSTWAIVFTFSIPTFNSSSKYYFLLIAISLSSSFNKYGTRSLQTRIQLSIFN